MMVRRASISGHIISIKTYVPNMNKTLMFGTVDDSTEFTVDSFKELYEEINGVKLKGNSFRRWMYVPKRGTGWKFDEKVSFHKRCCMLEFKYVDENFSINDSHYSRHSFI